MLAAIVALAASGGDLGVARLVPDVGSEAAIGAQVGFGLLGVGSATVARLRVVALGPLLLASLSHTVFQGNAPGSLASWAYAVAGALYIGLPISHFVRLRGLEDGLGWLALALLSTWICDTGAYVLGRAIGRHPFFPKKPHADRGLRLGGLISCIAGVMLLGHWLVALDWGWGALLGTLLALAATFGDLAESVIKRQAGAKDSGHLIPGHGGVLDRIDSLLFVVPLVYYFVIVILP